MPFDRRFVLKAGLAGGAVGLMPMGLVVAQTSSGPAMRTIPSSGEALPVVGLGSWITFNVGRDPLLLEQCSDVIAAFVAGGGRMIDSSPMYGSAQATIGYGLSKLTNPKRVFSADKIWTSSEADGPGQLATARGLWGVNTMDLMQVHNLLTWRDHLEMLQAKKSSGEIRYVGITTSHGRRHDELETIMANHPIDFVQLTYNAHDREAEQRLLPLATERGIAVIANRPFQRGALIRQYAGKPLPPFATDIDARSWAQLLLKFVISHPALTCAIPATSSVAHVQENLAAASGPLPDTAMRAAIATYLGQV